MPLLFTSPPTGESENGKAVAPSTTAFAGAAATTSTQEQQQERQRQRETSQRIRAATVEEVVWAGQSAVCAMNSLGEVVVCKSGICFRPTAPQDSGSDTDDGNESHAPQRGPWRFARVTDVSATGFNVSSTETGGYPIDYSVVVMAGLRTLRTFVLGLDPCGKVLHESLSEWPMGPFQSLAVLPAAGVLCGRPQVVMAAATAAGSVQMLAWEPLGKSLAQPTVVWQALLGPQVSLLGLAAGGGDRRWTFAALGMATDAPLTLDGDGGDGPAGAPSIVSLKGKDGRRLLVDDFFTAFDAGGQQRDPLNEVVAMLRGKQEPGTASASYADPAATLDAIAPAVLVAPPRLTLSQRPEAGSAAAHPFLLKIDVTTSESEGNSRPEFRCSSATASLTAGSPSAAALGLLGNLHRMLPGLRIDDDGLVQCAVYDSRGFVVLSATPGGSDKSLTVMPAARLELDGKSRVERIVALDWAPGQPRLMLIKGCEEVFAASDGSQPAAPAASGVSAPRATRQLGLAEVPLALCPFLPRRQSKEVASGEAAAPRDTPAHSHDALRELIRQVIKEEAGNTLLCVNARMDALESKLDKIVGLLEHRQ